MIFIYGTEPFLISKKSESIIRQHGENVKFIESNDSPTDIVRVASQRSIFSKEKSLTVVKNHKALSHAPTAKLLVKELEKMSSDDEILFIYEGKPTAANPLVKLLKKGEAIELNKPKESDMPQIIYKLVTERGGTITEKAAYLICEYIPSDLWTVSTEIDKLLTYSNKISEAVVTEVSTKYRKDDFFSMSNAISTYDVQGILKAYADKIALGIDPTMILSQFANQLILTNKILMARAINLSDNDISSVMGIHPFRIKKAMELCNYISIEKIRKTIVDIAETDQMIKNGKIDTELGVKAAVLRFIS